MSETAKSKEIEDVLASIRRLVGDPPDGERAQARVRALDGGGQIQVAGSVSPDSDNRLLLTPQLRVTEPEDPYQPIRSLLENGIDVTDNEGGDDAPQDLASNLEVEASDDEATAAEPDAIGGLDLTTIINLVGENAANDDVPEADKEEEQQEACSEEPRPELVVQAMLEQVGADDGEAGNAASDEPQDVEVAEDLSLPNDVPEFKSHAAAEIVEDAQAAEVVLDAERVGDAVEGLLDEAQLREIVADVVREELSGHLGERITRNVRKLVRRELRQLMASEDFG